MEKRRDGRQRIRAENASRTQRYKLLLEDTDELEGITSQTGIENEMHRPKVLEMFTLEHGRPKGRTLKCAGTTAHNKGQAFKALLTTWSKIRQHEEALAVHCPPGDHRQGVDEKTQDLAKPLCNANSPKALKPQAKETRGHLAELNAQLEKRRNARTAANTAGGQTKNTWKRMRKESGDTPTETATKKKRKTTDAQQLQDTEEKCEAVGELWDSRARKCTKKREDEASIATMLSGRQLAALAIMLRSAQGTQA
ncbi:hypothetical protein ERJ75_001813300 [Trypanosoma vivax]|nr:hypothetical protein ERJ75_001813300 [Trypanosoma vivax]